MMDANVVINREKQTWSMPTTVSEEDLKDGEEIVPFEQLCCGTTGCYGRNSIDVENWKYDRARAEQISESNPTSEIWLDGQREAMMRHRDDMALDARIFARSKGATARILREAGINPAEFGALLEDWNHIVDSHVDWMNRHPERLEDPKRKPESEIDSLFEDADDALDSRFEERDSESE